MATTDDVPINAQSGNDKEENSASEHEERVTLDAIKIEGKTPTITDHGDPAKEEGTCASSDSLNTDSKDYTSAEAHLKSGDEYFYTMRPEFTSELFKIEVKYLPKFVGFKQLRKMANKFGAFPKKVKLGTNGHLAYMSFGSEEERQDAITKMNGQPYKGKTLLVKPARPKADPLILKRKLEDQETEGRLEKKIKVGPDGTEKNEDEQTPAERILNAVTPCWKIAYADQLKMKEETMRGILRNVTGILKYSYSTEWAKERSKENDGICCCLRPVQPSPVTEKYRNKVEFNVGKDTRGEIVVGFRTGTYKGGNFDLMEPSACLNITDEAKRIAKCFQEYVQTSTYEPYNAMLHTGYWRQLTVRTCRNSSTMVIVQSHPQNLTKENVDEIKNSLKTHFSEGENKDKIQSLYIQLMGQRRSPEETNDSYIHVYGEKTIEEEIMNMKFRISPDAFFQTNTASTEVLYSVVKDLALCDQDTIVLDICCGTGTIGLALAKNGALKVIGLELSPQAVEDAKANALGNGVANAEFIVGKAEKTIYSVTKNLPINTNVIAIVDPPRAGLDRKVIQAIRSCSAVKRLIYVSCNPKMATNNFVDLCRDRTKRNKGDPFRLDEAIPVDLFPHTDYCELVLLFTRDVTSTDNDERNNPHVEQASNNEEELLVDDSCNIKEGKLN